MQKPLQFTCQIWNLRDFDSVHNFCKIQWPANKLPFKLKHPNHTHRKHCKPHTSFLTQQASPHFQPLAAVIDALIVGLSRLGLCGRSVLSRVSHWRTHLSNGPFSNDRMWGLGYHRGHRRIPVTNHKGSLGT